ncbi:hypothetical protein LWI29_001209 [Acer saccharum]|uniref:CCHC-type domain-containing protein n=1 Tax=Acer saccharum TaxID=4024 RepID=A0AA39VF22_ACESA|nr:hypothetical protein LWI29_001209 [Acer saccharum]
MKCIADNLSVAGNPVTEEDLVLYLLAGMGSDYDSVVVNVTARTDNLTLHEVYALLLNHESRMEQLAATTNIDTQTSININYAHIGQNQKGPGGRGSGSGVNKGYHRGKGKGRSNTGRNNGKPTCQICNKYGHASSVCYYRKMLPFRVYVKNGNELCDMGLVEPGECSVISIINDAKEFLGDGIQTLEKWELRIVFPWIGLEHTVFSGIHHEDQQHVFLGHYPQHDDDEEMALLVRKFRKFMRKGAKPSGKFSREKEVKKSFTPPHERSGHAKSNRKVQCFKCKKLGHYASDCPSGDTKKDKKGKAMAATWSEDDDSSDEESSSGESSSEEGLVSNFVAFTASHSILEDVCQDSLDKEVDQNHQGCLSENATYIDLLAKVKFLEENLKIALREVDEKDDLIKLQVDEFVSTTQRLLGEKNALAKKLSEVEGIVLEKDRIISNLSLGSSCDMVVEERLIEASLPTSEVIVEDKAPKKRRSKKKNKLKNKVPLETPICASPISEGKISSFVPICHFCNTVSHIKPKCFKFIEYCNMENASRN